MENQNQNENEIAACTTLGDKSLRKIEDFLINAPELDDYDISKLLAIGGAILQERAFKIISDSDTLDPARAAKRVALAAEIMNKASDLLMKASTIRHDVADRAQVVKGRRIRPS